MVARTAYRRENGLTMETLGLPVVMLMGLAFGAGPCNLTCLPYLGPVFLSAESGRMPWRTVLPFSAGRMTSYATLGLVAGLFGEVLANRVTGPYAGLLLGGATMLLGLSLLRRARRTACHRPVANDPAAPQPLLPATKPKLPSTVALFGMGAGMALNPCTPLATVLVAAAASGSGTTGLAMGLAFGLGAIVVPTLLFGYGVARFGRELRAQLSRLRQPLEHYAGIALLTIGTLTSIGWIKP